MLAVEYRCLDLLLHWPPSCHSSKLFPFHLDASKTAANFVLIIDKKIIDHFSVVGLKPQPSSECETGVYFVLI